MKAGNLDRRVQFLRAEAADDGYSSGTGKYLSYGNPTWASREDVKDAEKAAAGTIMSQLVVRFVVRSDPFTRTITPKDKIEEDGDAFEITGIKEIGRDEGIEITAERSLIPQT